MKFPEGLGQKCARSSPFIAAAVAALFMGAPKDAFAADPCAGVKPLTHAGQKYEPYSAGGKCLQRSVAGPCVDKANFYQNGKKYTPVSVGNECHLQATALSGVVEDPKTGEPIKFILPSGKELPVEQIQIGGKSGAQLIVELQRSKIHVSDYAFSTLHSNKFQVQPNPENLRIVRITVADLGFPQAATIQDIYAKAEELGLELCPAEVGPALRKKYKEQPLNEWLYIGMKQISDSDGFPDVFELRRHDDGLWLDRHWDVPGGGWGPDDVFVFRLHPSTP